jgi:hypothetical protein
MKGIHRTDLTKPKSPASQMLTGRAASIYRNIINAVARAYERIIQMGNIINQSFPQTPMTTLLHYDCMKHEKGASFVYKQLINRKAMGLGLMVAPAYYTWTDKIQHFMSQEQWFSSLNDISKIYISPRAKWNTIQIFLRTIWTPVKDKSSYGHSSNCLNCQHTQADTIHIFTVCTVARRVWNRIEKIIKMLNKWTHLTLTCQQILFHKNITDHTMIGLLVAGKHVITSIMRKVSSNPVHRRVIDAYVKASTLQLCDAYIALYKNTPTWMQLKSTILYVFNQEI